MSRKTKILGPAIVVTICITMVFGFGWAKKYDSDTPWIGVYTQGIDKHMAEAFDLDRDEGIVVVDVVDDSPADDAGLRRKDVIIEFNGNKIGADDRLIDYIRETEIGDEVEIVVVREGEEITLTTEIGKKPNVSWRNSRRWFDAQDLYEDALTLNFSNRAYLGVAIQDLNEQLGSYFGVEDGDGVLITEVFEDSPAEKAGLMAGDVIISVDGDRIYETDDLHDAMADYEDGDTVEIEYLRRGNRQTATAEVSEEAFAGTAHAFPDLDIKIPSIPKLPGLDHLYFDRDFVPEMGDFREEMQELREELEELREELRKLESKLD